MVKTPKLAKPPPEPTKSPKIPHIRGGPLVWRFSSADRGGPLAWSSLVDPAVYKDAMEKLHQFETMAETDMRRGGSHPVEKPQLSKEARDRLDELELDDLDELMSFRVSGASRIWCRIDRNMMLVLWWDPAHAVCPSVKKHT